MLRRQGLQSECDFLSRYRFLKMSYLFFSLIHSEVPKTTLNDLAGKLLNDKLKEGSDGGSSNNDDELLGDDDLAVDSNCSSQNYSSDVWRTSTKDNISPSKPKLINCKNTVEPLQDISVLLVEIKTGNVGQRVFMVIGNEYQLM